jgi:hypothetical protein
MISILNLQEKQEISCRPHDTLSLTSLPVLDVLYVVLVAVAGEVTVALVVAVAVVGRQQCDQPP